VTRATLLLMMTVLLLAAPTGAHAQGNIRVTPTPVAITFPAPGLAEFLAGYVDAPPVLVEVVSRPTRLPWELQITANAPDLGGYGKPVSDILWRPDGSATWQPLSTGDQVVMAGSGDDAVLVHFRMRLDWAYDEPGSYAVAFTFTGLRP
jgi:hypothetical protein